MIATAIFIIWQLPVGDAPPQPMAYRHHWITESWMHAIVEISDIQREIEQEENWMMMCKKWWVSERTDIGI